MLDERLGHHVVALVCAGLLILRPCRVGDDACAGRVALAANGVAAQLGQQDLRRDAHACPRPSGETIRPLSMVASLTSTSTMSAGT